MAATAKPVVVPVVAEVISPGAVAASAETAVFSAAQRDAAVATEEAGVAASRAAANQAELAAAQKAAAAAAREQTAAEVLQARKLAQLERGAAATGLTFLGLRGATLAASGGFIAGAAGAILFTKGIKEASDQIEQLNKSREVFGTFSKQVEDFAKTSATSFGESNAKALELVSTFGALLRPIGFSQKAAADVSLSLTKLGSDLASFFNTDVTDALNAIQSGLVGQVRPLRRYGVELSAARVNALALAETGKKVSSALTDQEKVAARVSIIFKDSAIAQGDFARTSDQFANQTRILTAQVSDLEGQLGRLAIPTLTTVLQIMNTTIGAAEKLAGALGSVADQFKAVASAASRVPTGKNLLPELPQQETGGGQFLVGLSKQIGDAERVLTGFSRLFIQSTKPVQTESEKTTAAITKIFDAAKQTNSIAQFDGAMNHLIETLKNGNPAQQKTADLLQQLKGIIDSLGNLPGAERFAALLQQLGISADTTGASTDGLRDTIDRLGKTATSSASGVDVFSVALKNLNAQAFAANSALLKLQNEGASPQAQRANLQGQRKIQEDRIAAIKANGNQAGDATAINAARVEINNINSQIKSLTTGIVSDQKKAASDVEQKAKDAQAARDKQFQALSDLFGGRLSKIGNLIERAGIAGNIQKEINLNKALIAGLKKERDALLARLKTLKVSADVRKRIFAAITAAIESAQQDQIRFQQEQQDNLLKVFDFRVSLAQARDDTVAELKARRQRLAAITAELARLKNAHKKNTDRWRELKLAQAEEIAAIKDLEGQTKEKNSAQKSLFFEFLQKQSGFAANLLGNLIPGFATAGLVGNAAQASGDSGLRQVAGGFEQPRGGAATNASIATSRDRGVRPVQVDTTNHLLRQILRSLQNLNGRASHPEARYQNRVAGSNMDTIGGV